MSVERCRAGILIAKIQQTKLRTKFFKLILKAVRKFFMQDCVRLLLRTRFGGSCA